MKAKDRPRARGLLPRLNEKGRRRSSPFPYTGVLLWRVKRSEIKPDGLASARAASRVAALDPRARGT
jgi:hypothetical protein